tara:strand:- start:1107 stop:1898 length:792 start_codon:yes stop_codon:yes gene_type:complete
MLDFPKINRENSGFQNNFLRVVILIIHLEDELDFSKYESKILDLFSNYPRKSKKPKNLLSFKINSPIGKNVVSESTQSVLDLKTVDGKKSIVFSSSDVLMEISGDSYTGFDELILNELKWINEIITLSKLKIKSLQLKKINLIGYEVTENQEPISIAERIFNKGLISNNSYIPSNQNTFKYKLDNIKYSYPDFDLNVKYGIISDSQTSGRLVLDIDVFDKKISEQYENGILETLVLLNNKIFDVFHWALNSEAKEILKADKRL